MKSGLMRIFVCLAMGVWFINCGEKVTSDKSSSTDVSIGPNGGVVASGDGVATLIIPDGAVSQSVAVSIKKTDTCPAGNIGSAFEFGPDGAQFAKPVQLIMRYDPAKLPTGTSESSLKLSKAVNGVWWSIPSSVVNTDSNTVSASLSSFSTYGVTSPGAGDNSAMAGQWDAVNSQMCNVLDGMRSVHNATLLLLRGLEKDFSIPMDVPFAYNAEETNWMFAGMDRLKTETKNLETQLATLDALEQTIVDKTAPAAKTAVTIKSAAKWCIRKTLGDFGKKLTMVEDELRELIYQYTLFLIETSIENPGGSGDIYVDDLKSLNCILKSVCGDDLGRKPWLRDNYDETVKNADIIYDLSWTELTSLNSQMISSGGCGTYHDFHNNFIKDVLQDLAEEGIKAYGEAYWKIYKGSLKNAVNVAISNSGEKPVGKKTAKYENDADAIVLFVPNEAEFNQLPIIVAAPRKENNKLLIPDVYEGKYTVFMYSKGNYPTMLENVTVSSSSQSIAVATPSPLPIATPSPFPARTAPDPMTNLNPPAGVCPTCELTDTYRMEYKSTYQSNFPWAKQKHTGTTNCVFEIKGRGNDADTTVFREPIVTQCELIGEEGPDQKIVYTPSSFVLTTMVEWTVIREVKEGKEWFRVENTEIIKGDSEKYTSELIDKNSGDVLKGEAELTSNDLLFFLIFPSNQDIGSDLPINWEMSIAVPGSVQEHHVSIKLLEE